MLLFAFLFGLGLIVIGGIINSHEQHSLDMEHFREFGRSRHYWTMTPAQQAEYDALPQDKKYPGKYGTGGR